MKTVLTNFLALGSIALLALASCKKNDAIVTSNGGKPGTLSASATTLVLDKSRLTDTSAAIMFSFSATSYGFSSAQTNTLQIDAAGDNWVNPTSVTLPTKVLSQGYSTANFNALLLKLNLPAGTASQVNVRVVNSLNSQVTPVYSNTLALTVTPFNLTSFIYVVGAYQGWNAGSPDSLVSVTGNGVYVGIIDFTAGNNQFLILPVKGSYNTKYATTDNGPVNTTVKIGANNNLYAPSAAGNYVVTLNINNSTISIVPANSYSVIGDAALGWNNTGDDVPMKFTNDLTADWTVTLPLVSTGAFKVRQNDDWTYSWGNISPSDGKSLTDSNGGNISIPTSGNYKVTFSIPITAVGTVPSASASYTTTKQ